MIGFFVLFCLDRESGLVWPGVQWQGWDGEDDTRDVFGARVGVVLV